MTRTFVWVVVLLIGCVLLIYGAYLLGKNERDKEDR